MSNGIPTDPPTQRIIEWKPLVVKAWGDSWLKPDVSYEFSNGRKFESSDNSTSGIYVPPTP